MEKYGFVYIWRDRKHNRYYIGSHWGTEDDGYVCSSKWMMQAYKHRPEDFKRKILSRVYSCKQDVLNEENHWLSMIKADEIKTKYYNLRIREFGHWSADKNLEHATRTRISIKTKEAMAKPENRERYLEGLKNRNQVQTDETKRKRFDAMKKTMSEKFPVSDRKHRIKRGTPEYTALQSELAKRRWAKQKINNI